PNALTCSATRRVSSILDRSPTATALACGTERRVSSARAVLRACSVTSWPPSTSSRAAINPRPSEEPEMNTRDIGISLRTTAPTTCCHRMTAKPSHSHYAQASEGGTHVDEACTDHDMA